MAVLAFLTLAMAAGVVACGGNPSVGLPIVTDQFRATGRSTPIDHVVIVIQENRSFDNFFATFPGADGTKTGKAAKMSLTERQYCAGQG
ncbi:MAG: alkaline phosphatase family protein, partial [Candidatus Cybelea sp.]